jgi:heme oxygenase
VDLPSRLRSREAYADLLARMFGFYDPLEAALGSREFRGIDLAARLKAPLLRADLLALGYSPDAVRAVPRCAVLPALTGLAELAGCLYVLEGATLGGQYVRREVARAFGLGPGSGCSFFSGYGERTGRMWTGFCHALIAYADEHPAEAGRIVATAAETFTRFGEWVAC